MTTRKKILYVVSSFLSHENTCLEGYRPGLTQTQGCTRPINRAPLGHTRFYCQGALLPWPDKTCNQFPIQFFIISRRNHSKWFGRYIYHISDHALSLKQTMNRPFILDSYPFLLPNSVLCTLIFWTQTELTLRMCGIPDEVAREAN